MTKDTQKITVVGAGLMGHGIAQEFALAGHQVWLHSRTQASLDQALDNIQANLKRLTDLGVITQTQAESVPGNVQTSTILAEAVAEADIVIESVFEEPAVKQAVFQHLDAMCSPHTILASNTSTLPLSQFTSGVGRLDKVVVTHYANPPYLVPVVEVVKGAHTSDETIGIVSSLLNSVGKRPVVLHREVPGFILNRLQAALLREALWLVENNVASPQDVDAAMRNSIGRRWAVAGVFEVFELAGWDVLLAASSALLPHLAAPSEGSALLKQKVEQGELGVKTGKGFYEWTPDEAEALRRRIAHALVEIEQWK